MLCESLLHDLTSSSRSLPLFLLSLFYRIIRRAVHAQIKLSDAQIDLNRWTKASKSTTYEHIGRAARSVLAATTIKYDEEVGRRQEQLNAALARLGELPDSMYSYVKDFKPEQKQKDAEKFLDEVKQWVEGLKPLVEVAEQKEKEAQAKRCNLFVPLVLRSVGQISKVIRQC